MTRSPVVRLGFVAFASNRDHHLLSPVEHLAEQRRGWSRLSRCGGWGWRRCWGKRCRGRNVRGRAAVRTAALVGAMTIGMVTRTFTLTTPARRVGRLAKRVTVKRVAFEQRRESLVVLFRRQIAVSARLTQAEERRIQRAGCTNGAMRMFVAALVFSVMATTAHAEGADALRGAVTPHHRVPGVGRHHVGPRISYVSVGTSVPVASGTQQGDRRSPKNRRMKPHRARVPRGCRPHQNAKQWAYPACRLCSYLSAKRTRCTEEDDALNRPNDGRRSFRLSCVSQLVLRRVA